MVDGRPVPRRNDGMVAAVRELRGAVVDWAVAEERGDIVALDRLLSDDFSAVGPFGFVLGKRDWLRRHGSDQLVYRTFELDEVRARRYDRTAVVLALQRSVGTDRGRPLPRLQRITVVLVDREGAWRMVALQSSFVAGTPGAPSVQVSPQQIRRQLAENGRRRPKMRSGDGSVADA